MKTTIKIDHPSDKQIQPMAELVEATYRIAEHIDGYWANIERCMAYLTENDSCILAQNSFAIIEHLHKAAARMRKLNKIFGDIPF